MQARAGVRERMAQLGPRVIRDHMPEQHRDFFAQLPFCWSAASTRGGGRGPRCWRRRRASCARPTRRRLRVDARPLGATRWRARSAPARRSACSASSRTRGGATASNGVRGARRCAAASPSRAAELRQLPEVHPGARAAVRRGARAGRGAAHATRMPSTRRRGAIAQRRHLLHRDGAPRPAAARRTASTSRTAAAGRASCASTDEADADRARLRRQLLLQHAGQHRGQSARRPAVHRLRNAATCCSSAARPRSIWDGSELACLRRRGAAASHAGRVGAPSARCAATALGPAEPSPFLAPTGQWPGPLEHASVELGIRALTEGR